MGQAVSGGRMVAPSLAILLMVILLGPACWAVKLMCTCDSSPCGMKKSSKNSTSNSTTLDYNTHSSAVSARSSSGNHGVRTQ